MPMYIYKCSKCEKVVEELQTLTEAPPNCCTIPMEKQLTSRHNFKFRAGQTEGGGWERQGELMIKKHRGGNTTRYGEGSV